MFGSVCWSSQAHLEIHRLKITHECCQYPKRSHNIVHTDKSELALMEKADEGNLFGNSYMIFTT